jgi:hypothetical protein
VADIVTDWRRFESGLWGYEEGDIYASYDPEKLDGDKLKRKRISKTFQHDGGVWVCGGLAFIGWNTTAWASKLLPATAETKPYVTEFSHEGMIVEWKRGVYILGPRMVFVASEMTVDEVIEMCRRMYAHGGQFAARKTYRQMLADFKEDEEIRGKIIPGEPSLAFASAAQRELESGPDLNTQAEMIEWLKAKPETKGQMNLL